MRHLDLYMGAGMHIVQMSGPHGCGADGGLCVVLLKPVGPQLKIYKPERRSSPQDNGTPTCVRVRSTAQVEKLPRAATCYLDSDVAEPMAARRDKDLCLQ